MGNNCEGGLDNVYGSRSVGSTKKTTSKHVLMFLYKKSTSKHALVFSPFSAHFIFLE